jgi:tetratricopeptide (TPR) repeat protein
MRVIAASWLLLVTGFAAHAQQVGDFKQCGRAELPTAIAACTRLIDGGSLVGEPLAATYVGRARAYAVRRDYQSAINDLSKAIEIEPNFAEAYFNRGLAHRRLGQNEEAITDYTKAIQLSPDNASVLNNRAWTYLQIGNLEKALPDVERAIQIDPEFSAAYDTRGEIMERLGRREQAIADYRRALQLNPNSESSRMGLQRLGVASVAAEEEPAMLESIVRLYRQGRYEEAVVVAEKALKALQARWGPSDHRVGLVLKYLGGLYSNLSRYEEAEDYYRRSISVYEGTSSEHLRTLVLVLDEFGDFLMLQARHTEAADWYRRAAELVEKLQKPGHPDVAIALNKLGLAYDKLGQFENAAAQYRRCIEIREKALGPDSIELAVSLNNLGETYRDLGRNDEAEALYKRSLHIREQALGLQHPDVATASNNLALLLMVQGRYAEADALFERALSVLVKAWGSTDVRVGIALDNLATSYKRQQRYAEAEPLYRQLIAIFETAASRGVSETELATALNNLAELYRESGRHADAEPLYRRAQSIVERSYGSEHPTFANILNNLALMHLAQGDLAGAEQEFRRAVEIRQKTLGLEHPLTSGTLNNLASVFVQRQDWAQAVDLLRQGTQGALRRRLRGNELSRRSVGYTNDDDVAQQAQQRSALSMLVKATHRLDSSMQERQSEQMEQTFKTAQQVWQSDAASALAQMTARYASLDPELGQHVRRRQDLVRAWEAADALLISYVSQQVEKRENVMENNVRARLVSLDAQIAALDQMLSKTFPEYAAYVTPEPLGVGQVQSLLGDGEALALFLDTQEFTHTPEETFIWVVTKTETRWVRSDLGTPALTREVAALRCGLDYYGTWGAEGSRCAELLRTSYTKMNHKDGKPLPFEPDRAHALYKALFGQIEDVIKDKQLLIVPSGALTQLPFQVLVTEKFDAAASGDDAFRQVAWLVRKHALTVLPAVSSLKALREHTKASGASRPFIGFGNPLLDGDPNDAQQREDAKLARIYQKCAEFTSATVVATNDPPRGLHALPQTRGRADRNSILRNAPLPDTANELCEVAEYLKADRSEVLLGAQATKTEIKRRNANSGLANFRVVHFATHGAVAGDLLGTTEPGLLLTPPEASEEDDGYLSASDIAGLKLDADWVILSACDTAAGSAESAEALSGLARAFFYAGARALLVSHWSVRSQASVALVTKALSTMAADPDIGRAQAMRRAMLHVIETGTPEQAHPAYWAPFIVVGEGRAGR